MDTAQIKEIEACERGALSGDLSFAQIVGRLAAIGVERYHVDYSRRETTYYRANGDSLVTDSTHPPHAVAAEFSSTAVAAAVAQSQRNEHSYAEFVRKTMAAGCVGYFAQISGRCVLYFGRDGQCHVERFPTQDIRP